jgi:hypothetical protein
MKDSAAGRLIGVLVSPRASFESIAQRPSWVLAVVLMILSAVGQGWIVFQHTDMAGAVRQQMEKQLAQSGQTLSVEEIDNRVEMMQKVTRVTSLAGPLVIVPASFLLIAVVFWLGLRLVGSEMRYAVSFSIALHALMPSVIEGLLSIPVILHRGMMSVDELRRGLLASSAAFFAPEGASPTLLALLGSLDLFSFWSLALLVVGFRSGSRLKGGLVAGVVIGIWALYVVGKVALTAVLPH